MEKIKIDHQRMLQQWKYPVNSSIMIHTSQIALIRKVITSLKRNVCNMNVQIQMFWDNTYCFAYDFIVITCVKKLTTLKIAKRVASIFLATTFIIDNATNINIALHIIHLDKS